MKPWANNKSVFAWYDDQELEIAINVDGHNNLAIMHALSMLYDHANNGEYEILAERIHLLGELIAAALTDNAAEIIHEVVVSIGMEDIDQSIEHFFEHHAEEYREDD